MSLERKPNGSFEMDPSVSGYEPVEGSCIHNSEPPSSIKVEDFPEYVRNNQVPKNGSAVFSYPHYP